MHTTIDITKQIILYDYNYHLMKSIKKLEQQLEEAKREKALQDI
jgi:hypothetical protein